jgi:hypothetical protein
MRSPGTRLDGVTGIPLRSADGIQRGSRVLVSAMQSDWAGKVQTGTVARLDSSEKYWTVKWDDGGRTSDYIQGANMVLLA